MEQFAIFQNDKINELNKFIKKTNGEVVSYNPFVVKYDTIKKQYVSLFDNRFTIGFRNSVNLLQFHYNNILIKEIVITPTNVFLMDTKDRIFKIIMDGKYYRVMTYNKGKFIKDTYPFDYEGDHLYRILPPANDGYGRSIDLSTHWDGGQSFEKFKTKLVEVCREFNWIPLNEEINSFMSKLYNDQMQKEHEKEIVKLANRGRKESADIIKKGLDNIANSMGTFGASSSSSETKIINTDSRSMTDRINDKYYDDHTNTLVNDAFLKGYIDHNLNII